MSISSPVQVPATSTKLLAFGRIAQAAVLLSIALIVFEFVAVVMTSAVRGSTDVEITRAIVVLAGLKADTSAPAISHTYMWVVGTIGMLPRITMVFALYQLWRYFQACLSGRAFERGPLRCVWRFSLASLVTSLLYIVIPSLAMQVLRVGTFMAHPFGPISIRSENLHAVFLCIGFLGIAAVLTEAARLADEIREFI